MKQPITTFLIVGLILITGLVQSQSADNPFSRIYTVEELKEDFSILRESLERTHAGLYAYTLKDEMDNRFDKIEASLNKPMTSIEFYRKIIALNPLIKNNHTKFSPPKSYMDAVEKTLPRFPFEVYWDQDKLYIVQNNSKNKSINEGSIIKSINGQPAVDVFYELVNNSRRDGFNVTGVESEIYLSFSKFYAYFKGTPSSFQLELITPNCNTINIEIEAITLDEIKKNKLNRYNDNGKDWIEKKEPVLDLRIDEKIAVLKLRQFYNPYGGKDEQKLSEMFNKSFEEIVATGVDHLIIDIRNNRGGNEYHLMDLFSHLYDKPFTLYKEKTATFKKIPYAKYYEENISWKNIYLPFMLTKKSNEYNVNKLGSFNGYYAGLKEKKPSKIVYLGKVYLLTNGISFSASGFMAGLLKNYNRGVVIGEESGGNASQCTASDVINLILPNSKINVNMPLMLVKLNVDFENTGHGVIPDYPIKPSIDDVLQGKDVVMEFTTKLIQYGKPLAE